MELDTTHLRLYQDQFSNGAYYCGNREWSDFDFKNPLDSSSTMEDWNIRFSDPPYKEGSGYFDLSFDKPVEDKIRITLPIYSKDFGASARLVAGLAVWNDNKFPRYEIMPLFDDSTLVLSIPRDEEETWVKYPQGIKERYGDSVLVKIGDRLGDSWEEIYVGEVATALSKNDSTIYTNIIDCVPWNDDSDYIKNFYPINTDPTIPSLGDGFTNIERYRGIFGIREYIDSSSLHPSKSIFSRLSPHIRHVFVVSKEDELSSDYSNNKMILNFDKLGYSPIPDSTISTDTTQWKWIRTYNLYENQSALVDTNQTEFSFYKVLKKKLYIRYILQITIYGAFFTKKS